MSYQSRVKTWIAGEVLYASDLNAEFDAILATLIPEPSSAVQGDILYKGSSTWDRLAAGTSGQFLKTQGASANPVWATATDGTLTTRGDLLYRGASANARLAKGTANQYLTSDGTDPQWSSLDISHDTSPTTGGGLTLGGNITVGEYAVELDYALSADGTYSGLTRAGTAGTNLSFGEVAYFASADSKWEKTDADAEATTKPDIAIVAVAGNEDAAVTLLTYGTIREDDWAWTTPGAPLFIDTATAGGLTETAPSGSGDCVRIAGYVIDANSIKFCPENAWDELA
jgi:hypothetical protein